VRVSLRFIDVFAERKFSGNQLCVVDDPGELTSQEMQIVAREIGFSETTFVTAWSDDRYAMRIFTPDGELPFAGHPTLGTAYVLVAAGRVSSPVMQAVAAGEFLVDVDVEGSFARMRQLPPVFEPEFEDLELVAAAAGLSVGDLHADLPPQVVSTGLGPLLAPVKDIDALRRAERDARAVREVVERSGGEVLYLFAISGDDVTARMFDPGVGIGEDPATGSAAGPLGAYLAARGVAGMRGSIRVAQGEQAGRPSTLHVDVQPEEASWVVHVGGGVHRVGEGWFDIP
jgi:trans-2,3-dihydro-3-hydroxyanthranilate isomerase